MAGRPATHFCCGCSLTFGTLVILVLNLLRNVFHIVAAFSSVVLKTPLLGAGGGLTSQTLDAVWCLLGLPFIISGIWGATCRMEGHVKVYLLYAAASFVLSATLLFSGLATGDVCDHMPPVLQKHGTAFACGFARIAVTVTIVNLLVIETYFLYTVWSLCEDIRAVGGGPGLPELLKTAGEHHSKRRYLSPYGDEHFGGAQPPIGVPAIVGYGAVDMRPGGLAGGQSLFNGRAHETAYPPPRLG